MKGKFGKLFGSYDISLLLLVLLICAFGLVMVYSTSYYNADRYYDDSMMYFNNQLKYTLFGIFLMICVSLVNYRFHVREYTRLRIKPLYLYYVICVVLQLASKFIGHSANGSSRWVQVGPISIQPSELTKILFILVTAFLVARNLPYMEHFGGMALLLVVLSPIAILIGIDDLSTMIVLLAILFVTSINATGFKRYYLVIAGVLLLGLGLYIMLKGYRAQRISVWLNPELEDSGSQLVQGMYAIASGGLFGKGLGESLQKLGKIQEVHTDMIFTVVCEELGLVGAIVILVAFIFLLYRIYVIATSATDLFGSLICVGAFVHIATQLLINIAVITKLVPATGLPFPFLSYGGSSMCVLLIEMGLVLSVSKQIPLEDG